MGRVLYFDIDGTLLDYEDQAQVRVAGRSTTARAHARRLHQIRLCEWMVGPLRLTRSEASTGREKTGHLQDVEGDARCGFP